MRDPALINVLHICGLMTAIAVLLAFVWDLLRRQPFDPVLGYCFLASLALWFLATVGLDSTVFLRQTNRLPPLTILQLFGTNTYWFDPALRFCGMLLPFVPLAIATRHRDCEAWVSRFGMLLAVSALAWILGNVLDRTGPRYIPKDFALLLGKDAGLMAWQVVRATALAGLGWAPLAFWSVWYVGVFYEPPRSRTPTRRDQSTG